jgi:hypothetical protein
MESSTSNLATGEPADLGAIRMVDACIECGYSLAGSPLSGKCPECGWQYDQSVMILRGEAMGKNATIDNASRRTLWRPLLKSGGPAALIGLSVLLDRGRSTANTLIAIGAVSLLIMMLTSRWSRAEAGLVVVYLSPAGCLQRDNSRPPVLDRAFVPGLFILLFMGMLGRALVTDNDGFTQARLISLLLTGLFISLYFLIRGLRLPPREPVRQTAAQILASGIYRWNGSEETYCHSISPDRIHLQIYQKSGKELVEIVDADVAGDAQRAGEIDRLIAAWKNAKSKPA